MFLSPADLPVGRQVSRINADGLHRLFKPFITSINSGQKDQLFPHKSAQPAGAFFLLFPADLADYRKRGDTNPQAVIAF